MTIDDILPRAGRWTPVHKERLINAAAAGQIHLDQITAAGISIEEFAGWVRAYAATGRPGLRTTRKMRYRRARPPQTRPLGEIPAQRWVPQPVAIAAQ